MCDRLNHGLERDQKPFEVMPYSLDERLAHRMAMEEKGYIERKRSHDDERVVSVFLTAAGLAMRDQAKDIPAGVGQCIHLEPDEAVCLYSLLYKILGQKKQ